MLSSLAFSSGFSIAAQRSATIPFVLLRAGPLPTLSACNNSLLEPKNNQLFNSNAIINKQFVCFKYRSRKPSCTARSRKKRYWVAKSITIDADEYTELFWRYANYRTIRRNLTDYFLRRRIDQSTTTSGGGEHAAAGAAVSSTADKSLTAAEAAEPAEVLEQLLLGNEEQNKVIGALRDAYFQQRHDQLIHHRRVQAAEWSDFKHEMRQTAVQRINQLTDESKSFINDDNIDAAIDAAFDNAVEFEYAIDTQGRKYWGRPQFDQSGKLVVFNAGAPPNNEQLSSLPLPHTRTKNVSDGDKQQQLHADEKNSARTSSS